MLKSRALAVFFGFAAISLQDSLALAQDLPIVGISTIKETVNDSRRYAKGNNFQAMLETQMAKVGRFKLIERSRVDEILAE